MRIGESTVATGLEPSGGRARLEIEAPEAVDDSRMSTAGSERLRV